MPLSTLAEAFETICNFCEWYDSQPQEKRNAEAVAPAVDAVKYMSDWANATFPVHGTTRLRVSQSRGAGWYPKVLWLAILPPDQQTSFGVYVCICFSGKGTGAVAGCMSSATSRTRLNTLSRSPSGIFLVDVDGQRSTTKYNNLFNNPYEILRGKFNEDFLVAHLNASLDIAFGFLSGTANPAAQQVDPPEIAESLSKLHPVYPAAFTAAKGQCGSRVPESIEDMAGQPGFRSELPDVNGGKSVTHGCAEVESAVGRVHKNIADADSTSAFRVRSIHQTVERNGNFGRNEESVPRVVRNQLSLPFCGDNAQVTSHKSPGIRYSDDWLCFASALPQHNTVLSQTGISAEIVAELAGIGVRTIQDLLKTTIKEVETCLGQNTGEELQTSLMAMAVASNYQELLTPGGSVDYQSLSIVAERHSCAIRSVLSSVALADRWANCPFVELAPAETIVELCESLKLYTVGDVIGALCLEHPYLDFDSWIKLDIETCLRKNGINIDHLKWLEYCRERKAEWTIEIAYRKLKDILQTRRWTILCPRVGLDPVTPSSSTGYILTLQQIADNYNLTRARVHQIEARSLEVLQQWLACRSACCFREIIRRLVLLAGGSMGLAEIIDYISQSQPENRGLYFGIARIIVLADERLAKIQSSEVIILSKYSLFQYQLIIRTAEGVHRSCAADLGLDETAARINSKLPSEQELDVQFIKSVLRTDNRFTDKKAGSEPPVTRKLNALIVEAIRELGSPMHHSSITEQVNKSKFIGTLRSGKNILNRLNMHSDIFVYCGRGTYGLAEWGIKPARPIADIILDYLTKRGWPATLEDITSAVLRERIASPASVSMVLSFPANNQGRFGRFHGQWGLSAWDDISRKAEPQDGSDDLLDLLFADYEDGR